MIVHRALRSLCRATFWPDGSVRRILMGPSSGLRYRVFPEWGLAPIFGRWEPALQRLIVQLLEPGDVAYDVGGNYGIHSLLMARLVGPTGTVCTFEPHPAIYEACSENIRLNRLANVKVLNVALGDVTGDLPFSPGDHRGAGHIVPHSEAAAFTVPCRTIDNLVAGGELPPPMFIKIDVEGHEGAVLAGARATLDAHRPVLAVDLHHPEADRSVGHALIEHGYVAYRQQSLEPIIDLRTGWPAPNGIHGSILALPRESVSRHLWLPKAS